MNKVTVLRNHIEFKKTSVSSKEKLQDIERYLNMFINSKKKPLSKFTENDLNEFLNTLKYSIRTINDIKIYLKVFIKWCFSDYSSRFRNLDRICKQQKPAKAYTPEQMLTIKEIEKLANGEKDLMYKVYWLVLFYGGFRPSECARLKWSDISFDPDGVIIKIHSTKTKRDFIKGIPHNVENLLKEWKKYNKSEFVFPSPVNDNDVIRARSICAKLKRLSKRVLGKKVVPYQLRHSIATFLYKDDNRKDDDIANQLGHTKSMKQVYLNLDEETLKTKARNLWLNKDLSPEKKHQLEEEIKLIREQLNTIIKGKFSVVKEQMALEEKLSPRERELNDLIKQNIGGLKQ